MAGERELRIRVVGDSTSGEKALNKTATAAEKVAPSAGIANKALGDVKSTLLGMVPGGQAAAGAVDKVGEASSATGGLMKGALVGGAAAAGVALAKMTADGIQQFTALATETRGYQRVVGGTAESASAMVVAFREMGVDSEAASKGMFKLSREVESGNAALGAYGVQVAMNKDGTTDLNGTLLNVVDAYNATDDAAQRNAIAFAAFGKAGVALTPILAKGRDGLKELWAAAANHGEIMSQDDINQAIAFKRATRDLGEAFKGLEIQLAKGLVPTLTSVTKNLSDVTDAANKLTKPLGGIGGAIDGVFKSAQQLLPIHPIMDLLHGDFDQAAHDTFGLGAGIDVVQGHYRDALGNILPMLGSHKKATEDAGDATKKLGDDTDNIGGAAAGATPKVSALDGALVTLKADMTDGKARAEAFKTALDALTGAPADAEQATIKYKDSVQSLGDALHDNGAAFDLNTGAGRKNISALDDAIEAAKAQLAAMVEQKATTGQLTDALNRQRASLINTLKFYGFADRDIQGLLASRGLTSDALGSLLNTAGAANPTQTGTAIDSQDFRAVRTDVPSGVLVTGDVHLQVNGSTLARITNDQLAAAARRAGLS